MKHARTDYDERIQDAAGLIPDDEPVLLIRGQDACALATIAAWMNEARRQGADADLIEAVRVHGERGTQVPRREDHPPRKQPWRRGRRGRDVLDDGG